MSPHPVNTTQCLNLSTGSSNSIDIHRESLHYCTRDKRQNMDTSHHKCRKKYYSDDK